MSRDRPTSVTVVMDAPELGARRPIGVLRPAGTAVDAPIAFSYDIAWITEPSSFAIDPTHYLAPGDQYPPRGTIAPIFTDTSPDRWGRILLEYREVERASREQRKPRALGEWDFLLGVSDEFRMGALRYAAVDGGFYDDDPLSVPPIAELRELEAAVRTVEAGNVANDGEIGWAVRQLLAPGSPLGGARPKTSFRGSDGASWLAKFPSRNDRRDVGAWEFLLNELARGAGIQVPATALYLFLGPHHTFAARRFDRTEDGRRLFASAMTMLSKLDREPGSYVELAEAIAQHGAPSSIEEDMEQLFRRLVFNVVVGHRDDHLRNHGFLRTTEGWRLAPAYDLNPMPDMALHELAIGLDSRAPDLRVVVDEAAPFFRLGQSAAAHIVDEVRTAVSAWRGVARHIGLPTSEVDLVSSAFLE
jgi:serine/threonine-protein kinase HipA